MRVYPFLLAVAALLPVGLIAAQDQNKPAVVHMNDGGYDGPLQSIFVPPKAGAPFSLTLATEWTRPLNNGGSFTLANERRIVRDSYGRIYQERWILVPKGGPYKSHMNVFQITDPELHRWYNCETATKVCELLTYHLTTVDKYVPSMAINGSIAKGMGTQVHQDLGTSSVEDVPTHGYRDTQTLNPGAMGNDAPMVTTREFWWSPDLGLNLISIVDSPRFGKQVFRAKDISTTPPDAGLFVVPDDYKVVDRRDTSD